MQKKTQLQGQLLCGLSHMSVTDPNVQLQARVVLNSLF